MPPNHKLQLCKFRKHTQFQVTHSIFYKVFQITHFIFYKVCLLVIPKEIYTLMKDKENINIFHLMMLIDCEEWQHFQI